MFSNEKKNVCTNKKNSNWKKGNRKKTLTSSFYQIDFFNYKLNIFTVKLTQGKF